MPVVLTVRAVPEARLTVPPPPPFCRPAIVSLEFTESVPLVPTNTALFDEKEAPETPSASVPLLTEVRPLYELLPVRVRVAVLLPP